MKCKDGVGRSREGGDEFRQVTRVWSNGSTAGLMTPAIGFRPSFIGVGCWTWEGLWASLQNPGGQCKVS